MNKGFRMMLEALGIHIDPGEIEQLFQKLKHDMPAAAAYVEKQFKEINDRLERIEHTLDIAAPFPQAGTDNQVVKQTAKSGSTEILTADELQKWQEGNASFTDLVGKMKRRLLAIKRAEVTANGSYAN